MAYKLLQKLPSFEELINKFPLSKNGYEQISRDQAEIKDILKGKDNRLLIIVGPCSAWPESAVLEYANRLVELNKKVSRTLKIVMRVYIQKPRTIKGWLGPLNQPDPAVFPNIEQGTSYSRQMMVKVVEMGLPIADEALFTHNAKGFIELLSWVAIGARSTEDYEHRIFASSLDCAVGMKNPTHGALKVVVNSVASAQHSHIAAIDGFAIETSGNPYAHVVLRGCDGVPNYSLEYIAKLNELMEKQKILNPSVIIDVSHDNCLVNGKKDYRLQPKIIFDILDSLKQNPNYKPVIKGFMIESFLQEGCQSMNIGDKLDLNGLSITDPCLGWDKTEELLLRLAEFWSLESLEQGVI